MNALARELFGDVANRDDAAAPQNDPFDVVRAMGEAENTARRNKLSDLPGGNGEAAFTKAKEHEGLRLKLSSEGHGAVSTSWGRAASSAEISPGARKPS